MHNPEKAWSSVTSRRCCSWLKLYMRALSIVNACERMICPRYFTLFVKKEEFSKLSKAPAFRSVNSIMTTFCRWVSNNFAMTIMSSKYARHNHQLSPLRRMSSVYWKVGGALVRPNGMSQNLGMLDLHVNVDLSRFFLAIGTGQYSQFASSVKIYVTSHKTSPQLPFPRTLLG